MTMALRALVSKHPIPPCLSLLFSSRSLSNISPLNRLRPLVALSNRFSPQVSRSGSGGLRCFSTSRTASSLNDPSPNWSNRPPKETILLDGCDFEHWLVVVEPPDQSLTRDEIIQSYIKTLAKVVGSEEEARFKIYSVSTKHYFAFGALVSEELSYKLKELPGVRWVLPDSYLDVKNKDYGGEPFINGEAVPYDPKYHEEWVRNNARANERNRRNDRPRNSDRSRNFERRRENMQNFQNRAPPPPLPDQDLGGQPGQNPSPARDMPPVPNASMPLRDAPNMGSPNRDIGGYQNQTPNFQSNIPNSQSSIMPNRGGPGMTGAGPYQTGNSYQGPSNAYQGGNGGNQGTPNAYQGSFGGYQGNPNSYQSGAVGYPGGPSAPFGDGSGYKGMPNAPPGGPGGYTGSSNAPLGGSHGYPGAPSAPQGGPGGYTGSSNAPQGDPHGYPGAPSAPHGGPSGYQGPPSSYQGGPGAYQGTGSPYQGGGGPYQGRDMPGRDQ